MKILFIGGTGVISSGCSRRAIESGYDLFHLNRGKTGQFRKIDGVHTIIGDIRNPIETKRALKGNQFDVVVDWISFAPEHIRQNMDLFAGKTEQYVFISSASVYQTPPEKLPITEKTPAYNPFWEYSRKKIECEQLLHTENEKNGFPFTIVRPSHTYDKTKIPITGKYTALDRMKKGLPVVVQGDGTSLWTLTHQTDFALGFNGLLGNRRAIGETIHITSDEWLSWLNIYHIMARKLSIEPKLFFAPSQVIAKFDPETGDGLLGDKSHSMIFDNSKIKNLVPEFKASIPFEEGASEIIDWFGSTPSFQIVDPQINRWMDKLIARYSKL